MNLRLLQKNSSHESVRRWRQLCFFLCQWFWASLYRAGLTKPLCFEKH